MNRFVSSALLAIIFGASNLAQAWEPSLMCSFPEAPTLDVDFVGPLLSEGLAASPPAGDLYCTPIAQPATSLSPAIGRDAWDQLDEVTPSEALLRLHTMASIFPSLTEFFALKRAEIYLQLEQPSDALREFARAQESEHSSTRYAAEVGRVRALIALAHARLSSPDARPRIDAEAELTELRQRYPDLPDEPSLLFALAQLREAQDRGADAAQLYRAIYVQSPASSAAADAASSLERLREAGLQVRDLSLSERVTRASRLVSRGPLSRAKEELAVLDEEPTLSGELRAQVTALLARIAQHEGRFAEAQALREGTNPEDAQPPSEEQLMAEARARYSSLRGRGAIKRVPTARLIAALRAAISAQLPEESHEAMQALIARDLPPRIALDVASLAAGNVPDDAIAALLTPIAAQQGSLATAARYHLARALQRMEAIDRASALYEAVITDQENSITPYYAMWARQQLSELQRATPEAPAIEASGKPMVDVDAITFDARTPFPAPDTDPAPPSPPPTEERAESATVDEARMRPEDYEPSAVAAPIALQEAAARLAPIAALHGEAYPWLLRAEALLRLGERELAREQLYEAFLAWRQASGRPIQRTGLESVARGADRARTALPAALRRARRTLNAEARAELSELAEALGGYGTSTGFGGWSAVSALPRAYAAWVEEAALAYELDPNLLFAVMRVESVYQEHIVSRAGAIGLCQIMPRTGQLIANELELGDYTAADLLDGRTNLRFAAWYLRSLIDRFEGHLPLAIASYNGGPHNVRRWLSERPATTPLDAFLEQIPFTETHRYVRRVLTNYEAYRAQQGLEMIALSTALPAPQPDTEIGF